MSLLGDIAYEQTDKFMDSFIRYEEPRQLFYDNLVGNTIKVETDKNMVVLLFEKEGKIFQHLFCDLIFYKELAGQVAMNPLNSLVGKAEYYVMQNILRGDLDKRKSNNVIPQHLMYTEFDS